MKRLIMVMALLALSSCHKIDARSRELVSKEYFVPGMTCGGCIIAVKLALGKSDQLKIIDKNIDIGVARLQFDKESYKIGETDCEVTTSIEKVTEFKVFLDKDHTKRGCRP